MLLYIYLEKSFKYWNTYECNGLNKKKGKKVLELFQNNLESYRR